MKVIGLAGKFAVGKTTAAKEIAAMFGIEYVCTSDLIKAKVGADAPREEYIKFFVSLIDERGPDGAAQFVYERLDESRLYVIDRFVETADMHYVQSNGGLVLMVTCAEPKRKRRIFARNRSIDGFTGEQWHDIGRLMQIDYKDRTQVAEATQLADYVLDTTNQHANQDDRLASRILTYLSASEGAALRS